MKAHHPHCEPATGFDNAGDEAHHLASMLLFSTPELLNRCIEKSLQEGEVLSPEQALVQAGQVLALFAQSRRQPELEQMLAAIEYAASVATDHQEELLQEYLWGTLDPSTITSVRDDLGLATIAMLNAIGADF